MVECIKLLTVYNGSLMEQGGDLGHCSETGEEDGTIQKLGTHQPATMKNSQEEDASTRKESSSLFRRFQIDCTHNNGLENERAVGGNQSDKGRIILYLQKVDSSDEHVAPHNLNSPGHDCGDLLSNTEEVGARNKSG